MKIRSQGNYFYDTNSALQDTCSCFLLGKCWLRPACQPAVCAESSSKGSSLQLTVAPGACVDRVQIEEDIVLGQRVPLDTSLPGLTSERLLRLNVLPQNYTGYRNPKSERPNSRPEDSQVTLPRPRSSDSGVSQTKKPDNMLTSVSAEASTPRDL